MTGVQTCALPICFPVTIRGDGENGGRTRAWAYDNATKEKIYGAWVSMEVCLMIDNSGSMSWDNKPTYVTEALVLFIESIRKIECPFAIARFGNINDKFTILKRMNEGFSYIKGQHILEQLTYDQATRPATALRRISNEVWPP